jgi:hypothetical protein
MLSDSHEEALAGRGDVGFTCSVYETFRLHGHHLRIALVA